MILRGSKNSFILSSKRCHQCSILITIPGVQDDWLSSSIKLQCINPACTCTHIIVINKLIFRLHTVQHNLNPRSTLYDYVNYQVYYEKPERRPYKKLQGCLPVLKKPLIGTRIHFLTWFWLFFGYTLKR